MLIGAHLADPNGVSAAGESYVVFGKSTGFSPSFDLTTLDGTNGFVLNGIEAQDQSGGSVSSAGDINGDGYDDLIIGAAGSDANGSGAGQSYVVFGRDHSVTSFAASLELDMLDGNNGFVIEGLIGDASGSSVSSAGDINGDGFDDLIVGAPGSDPNGDEGAGQSYIVFGKSGNFSAIFSLYDMDDNLLLDGSNGFVLKGIDEDDNSGSSVSSAGDINGDGFDDLLIGAPTADLNGNSNAGETYVIYGSANFGRTVTMLTSGNDIYTVTDMAGEVVFGLAGIDTITGNAGNDALCGDAGDDMLYGDLGDDELHGGLGADILNGGAGDDIINGGNDADAINGGTGNDLASYVVSSAGVYVSLRDNAAAGGDAAGDVLSNIENLKGSAFDDTLVGNDGINILIGSDGVDTLSGLGGSDLLSGGADDDVLNGQNGNDNMNGDGGNDSLFGGNGFDTMNGGAGDDMMNGGLSGDTMNGDDGNDMIFGATGADLINGGNGNDTVFGGIGADIINGGSGIDTLNGGQQDDIIDGGDGDDMINGNVGIDSLSGGAGMDTIDGGASNDIIYGGEDNDDLFGNAGNDTMFGDNGDDIIDGGGAQDVLYGGAGNDTVIGLAGFDQLFGDGGNDILDGGLQGDSLTGGDGNDTMTGGGGPDIFIFNGGFGDDIITDFTVNLDDIDFSGHTVFNSFADVTAVATQVGADVVINLDANNILTLEGVTLAQLDAGDFIF